MLLNPLHISMLFGILLIIIGLAIEIRRWYTGGRAVTRKQKSFRIASGILLIGILSMILAGDKWLVPRGTIWIMSYWMLCFILAVILVTLALLDLKEVGQLYGEGAKHMIHDIVKPAKEDSNEK